VATDKKWVPWLKREAALRNKCGFPCRFLDKGRLKSVVSSSFEAALFDLKDFQVHPVKFVRGLASRAEKYGAQLYEHSPALKWNAHQVKTSKGVVTAEKVIVAIESKTPFLRPHRKNAQVIVTNPLRNAAKLGWKRGHMLWEVGLHYHAVRFWNNRLMVAKEIPNNSTERQKKVHAEKMVRLLLRDFPVLSKDDVSVSHRWDCFVVHSQRGIFTISHEHGVYYVYGCAGNGLTHGTLAGKIFADHFSGKPLPKIYVPSSNVRLSGCTW
jgi:glycine/D-amino acid oxidase-like deaminating enzyme